MPSRKRCTLSALFAFLVFMLCFADGYTASSHTKFTASTRTTPILQIRSSSLSVVSHDKGDAVVGDVTSVAARIERRRGLLVLISVPLAWGTFEPAVRYVYALDPPLPGFVFSTLYYLVAAITLLGAAVFSSFRREGTSLGVLDQDESPSIDMKSNQSQSWPILGGAELGLYLFLGNALQVIGLKTVPADRAAFLLQLTTVFVPLLQRNISIKTWSSCLLALFGVAVMGLEGKEHLLVDSLRQFFLPASGVSLPSPLGTSLIPDFSAGDAYVVAAAVAYSFHCIRLERYAKTTEAVRLAASKASAETLFSAAAAGLFVLSMYSDSSALMPSGLAKFSHIFWTFCQESGREITNFFQVTLSGMNDGSISALTLIPAVLAILWTGWVTCGYTIYAQSYGQRRVSPVTANLIYTIQPVCTAITAYLVLGERLAPAGFVGGVIIAVAVLLVALADDSN